MCLLTHCQAHFWRPLRHGVWCGLWYLERGWRSFWEWHWDSWRGSGLEFACPKNGQTLFWFTPFFCAYWFGNGLLRLLNPRIGMIPFRTSWLASLSKIARLTFRWASAMAEILAKQFSENIFHSFPRSDAPCCRSSWLTSWYIYIYNVYT